MTDNQNPVSSNPLPETPAATPEPVTPTVPKSDDYGLVDVPKTDAEVAAQATQPTPSSGGLSGMPAQTDVMPQKKSKKTLYLLLFLLLLLLIAAGAIFMMNRPSGEQNNVNSSVTPTPTTGAGDENPSVTPSVTVAGTTTPSVTVNPSLTTTPTFTIQLGGSYIDADFYRGGMASFKYPTGGTLQTTTTGLPDGVDRQVDVTFSSPSSPIQKITYLVGTSAEPIFAGDVVEAGNDSVANTASGFPLETKAFTKLVIADSDSGVFGVYFEFGDRHFAIYRKEGVAEATWMATAKQIIAQFNYAQD